MMPLKLAILVILVGLYHAQLDQDLNCEATAEQGARNMSN
jgi:hypothetical protein